MRRFLPFAKQFVTVTPGRHTRPPLAGSVLPQEMLEYTKFRPRRSCARSEFSTYFPDAPADQSQEVLEIASGVGPGLALSERGPCLGGTVTLGDVLFTTEIAIYSGGDAIGPYRCVALLDTGSPQTFIRRYVLGRMLLVGAASPACERPCSPRSWAVYGEYSPLRTSTSIRLSVQFFRGNEATCSLAVPS